MGDRLDKFKARLEKTLNFQAHKPVEPPVTTRNGHEDIIKTEELALPLVESTLCDNSVHMPEIISEHPFNQNSHENNDDFPIVDSNTHVGPQPEIFPSIDRQLHSRVSIPNVVVEIEKPEHTVNDTAQHLEQSEPADGNSIEITASARQSLQSAITEIGNAGAFAKTVPSKREPFIFDVFTNAIYFSQTLLTYCRDFILEDDEVYPLSKQAITDYSDSKTTNIRTAYLNNSLNHLGELTRSLLYSVSSSDKFYLLPDNTDFFMKPNIKQGFNGYRFIWRSIAAAYHYYSSFTGREVFTVVDLFENEPAKVSIRAEFSQKYGSVIFTRVKHEPLANGESLSYGVVSEAFWKYVAEKLSLPFEEKSMALSEETFSLLCRRQPVTIVFGSKAYRLEKGIADSFLTKYLGKTQNALNGLVGSIVFGDHVFITPPSEKRPKPPKGVRAVWANQLGNSLEEYVRRINDNIPLWEETLPELTLLRMALPSGRLGSYTLVSGDVVVPNLFDSYSLPPCKEELELPARHKIVKFPLSIKGISDKSYIARIELENELEVNTKFSVGLNFDFNNETSYDFILTDVDKNAYKLVIEEGEPDKLDRQFEIKIEDDDSIISAINKELNSLLVAVKKRASIKQTDRKTDDFGHPKEKPWEFEARKACSNLFSLNIGLSYETRTSKNFQAYDSVINKIGQHIATLNQSEMVDAIDSNYISLVHATLALFSNHYQFDKQFYDYYSSNKNKYQFLTNAMEPKLLCNPAFDCNIIDELLDSLKGEQLIRAFSLPLLANDMLLDYICKNKRGWLNSAKMALSWCLEETLKSVEDSDAQTLQFVMMKARDCFEFILGLLKLRETEYWKTVKSIEGLLDTAVRIEQTIYDKLSVDSPEANSFIELCEAQKWRDQRGKEMDCNLMVSRITFKDNDSFKALSMMHPLALTAITYLEGNPDIHIIGCGLKDEVE